MSDAKLRQLQLPIKPVTPKNGNEHNPPHFHAIYGEEEGQIGISPLALIEGRLSGRALGLAMEWAALHQKALLENWELMRKDQPPHKIPPLK